MMPTSFEYLLVGGGLQNSLIMLALLHRNPSVRLAIIEKDSRIGGNHTWSLHTTDIPPGAMEWFKPAISHEWPRYEVRFPNRRRMIEIGYASIFSADLHELITQRGTDAPGVELLLERGAIEVGAHHVTLDDGTRLEAPVVIDSSGPKDSIQGCGYQKFVGWEVELAEPMKSLTPIVMDSLVEQHDGFRFHYMLPYSPTRCLFEETYFSDGPTLDLPVIRRRIESYIHDNGYRMASLIREETGVLPMPWKLDLVTADEPGPLRAGYKGGWFHPATCYSLPVILRLSQLIANSYPTRPAGIEWEKFVKTHRSQSRFASLLNALLFRTFPPEARWHIFERFYGFPMDTIRRFYSLELTTGDKLRFLCGRPPRGFSLRQLWRQPVSAGKES
ncbi:lycopene beta-cyclase CrtY [bacterium]|nr:lycopene beta-cyclase CrtY [bacterium]